MPLLLLHSILFLIYAYHFLQIHSQSQSKKQRNKMVEAQLSKSKQFVGGELRVDTPLHMLPVSLLAAAHAANEMLAK
jgi:hypothetical protein